MITPITRRSALRLFGAGAVALVLPGCANGGGMVRQLIDDGVWTWFSDPRAVWAGGKLFVGYKSHTGIRVAQLNGDGNVEHNFLLLAQTSPDDHDVPAITVLPDGRLVAAYATHSDGDGIRVRIGSVPFDVSSFGPEFIAAAPQRNQVTYAQMWYLSAEDRIYLFYRDMSGGDFDSHGRTFITSDDGGVTWSAPTDLMVDNDDRPYTQIDSNGVDRIDISMTDGHPASVSDITPTNSLYHLYYDGAWRTSDGTDLGSPPFAFTGLIKIYDAVPSGVSSWNWDVWTGANPVALYVTLHSETDQRYQYARWDGSQWVSTELVQTGGTIAPPPGAGTDSNYSAGLYLDHSDPSTVVLSNDATGVWEIERWITGDNGATWAKFALTTDTPSPLKNFRPIVARGVGSIRTLWLRGDYDGYSVWSGGIFTTATPPPPVADFTSLVTGSHRATFEARVLTSFQTGEDPDGTVMPIIGGDVTYDATAQIFADCNLTTAGRDEFGNSMFPRHADDLLAPYGNEIFVRRGIDRGGAGVQWVPLGYFRINEPTQDGGSDQPITLQCQDRMAAIVEATLVQPVVFPATATFGQVVDALVSPVYPQAVIAFDDDAVNEQIGRQYVVESDRYAALLDIAYALGKIVYFDGLGVLRIETAPDPATFSWDLEAGSDGVLVDDSRTASRMGAPNGVIARGKGADNKTPVQAIAIDASPTSPTRWGGPFGTVPDDPPYESPLLTTNQRAANAAGALMRRFIGETYAAGFSAVPNPTVRPYDVVRMTRKDGNRELHVIDQLTVPLVYNGAMTGATRASRRVVVRVL